MAKGRMINKRLCKSKKYAELTSDRSRVLYVLMYINADREGRVDGDPEEIKDEFCTKLKYTHRKIAESIIELHNVGLIKLYEVNDHPYIQFLEFDKYQPGLRKDREAESEIPESVRSKSGLTPSLYLSLSLSLKQINKTIKDDDDEKLTFDFETQKFTNIKPEDLKRWAETYPACDIEIELLKMEDWLLSNPSKKKKNYRRFMTNWLSRCQEKGGTKEWDRDQQRGRTVGIEKPRKKSPKEIEYENLRTGKVKELTEKYKSKFAGEELELKIKTGVAKWSQEFWGDK